MLRPPARAAALAAVLAIALSAVLAPAARAQGGELSSACAGQLVVARDACQKASDLFQFLAPQLGVLVAGGNVEPGQGGALGGLGHFGLSVRANALRSPLPEFNRVSASVTGPQRSSIPVEVTTVVFPVADLAVGLFNGVSFGGTRVGGVDALVNATYVPDISQDQAGVTTAGGSVRVGYGARLGLLSESAVIPGVSVSVLRRATPTARIVAVAGDDSLDVSDTRTDATSWRLTASKRLLIVSLAAGVGQDRLRTRALVRGVAVVGPVSAASSVRLRQSLTRTNYFANLTLLAIPFARIVGEVGRSTGGSLAATYNDIDGRRPDAAYTYGSLGLRVGR